MIKKFPAVHNRRSCYRISHELSDAPTSSSGSDVRMGGRRERESKSTKIDYVQGKVRGEK